MVTGSYGLAAQLHDVDIVVDVTPSPAIGAETAWSCIQHSKDVVLVNIEADVTVGRILKRHADKAGILYTVSSGDEPGCIMELWDYVQTLGFAAYRHRKGKEQRHEHRGNPDTVAESARKDGKDPLPIASYVDGTKTMFEMASVANATGCLPIKRGMVGPEASRQTVSDIFSLKEDGGICPFPGVVDFVQGNGHVGRRLHDGARRQRAHRRGPALPEGGQGRYTTFFRPYHLWFIEAPISVARAHLYREPWLVPLDRPVVEVLTIAKKDLAPGETLDDSAATASTAAWTGPMKRRSSARCPWGSPRGRGSRGRCARAPSSRGPT